MHYSVRHLPSIKRKYQSNKLNNLLFNTLLSLNKYQCAIYVVLAVCYILKYILENTRKSRK